VLVVPGGVTMSLAGVPVAGGVEVPWPQVIHGGPKRCSSGKLVGVGSLRLVYSVFVD